MQLHHPKIRIARTSGRCSDSGVACAGFGRLGVFMFRILSFVLMLIAGSWALPGLAADYDSKELADAGAQYKQDLLDKVPAVKRKPNLIQRLRSDAADEYKAKRYDKAVEDLETAISYGADDGLVWLRLSQAQLESGDEDHVMAAAYNAYRKSTDPVERAEALF